MNLAYYLAADHWGRGLGFEAASAFTEYARSVLRLPGIVAGVEVGNAASEAILRKLSFTEYEIERLENGREIVHYRLMF